MEIYISRVLEFLFTKWLNIAGRSDGKFVDDPASLKTSTCMKLFFHAKKKSFKQFYQEI